MFNKFPAGPKMGGGGEGDTENNCSLLSIKPQEKNLDMTKIEERQGPHLIKREERFEPSEN